MAPTVDGDEHGMQRRTWTSSATIRSRFTLGSVGCRMSSRSSSAATSSLKATVYSPGESAMAAIQDAVDAEFPAVATSTATAWAGWPCTGATPASTRWGRRRSRPAGTSTTGRQATGTRSQAPRPTPPTSAASRSPRPGQGDQPRARPRRTRIDEASTRGPGRDRRRSRKPTGGSAPGRPRTCSQAGRHRGEHGAATEEHAGWD